jgi:copper ion binding protein
VTAPAATSVWQVSGMTCEHCVSAVREELGALAGVDRVDVVLETGTVTVTGDVQPDRAAIAAAVEEAGYQLV